MKSLSKSSTAAGTPYHASYAIMARAKLKDLEQDVGKKKFSCQNSRLLVPFHAALVGYQPTLPYLTNLGT